MYLPALWTIPFLYTNGLDHLCLSMMVYGHHGWSSGLLLTCLMNYWLRFYVPSILFNQIHLFSVPLPCMQVTAGAYTTTVTNTCHLWHLRQQRKRSSNFNQITNKNLATANRPTAHHLRKQHVDSINSNPVTLNSRLTVTQGHWNCYHSKA